MGLFGFGVPSRRLTRYVSPGVARIPEGISSKLLMIWTISSE